MIDPVFESKTIEQWAARRPLPVMLTLATLPANLTNTRLSLLLAMPVLRPLLASMSTTCHGPDYPPHLQYFLPRRRLPRSAECRLDYLASDLHLRSKVSITDLSKLQSSFRYLSWHYFTERQTHATVQPCQLRKKERDPKVCLSKEGTKYRTQLALQSSSQIQSATTIQTGPDSSLLPPIFDPELQG